ncbi:DUF4269 domain-containing protein [Ornithinibacillus californiensis]|uniref:DUF4269 domain-containing protein n=1 Tax=Ornithinibacillus californiensis TaxID=161536 RepID=UPI00064D9F97|nr:DUF4269 domain-containing protein [Ornithinibacillus californiensis]
MFDSLRVLKDGTEKQQRAYKAIHQLNIMNDLADFNPIVCGTIPIGIGVDQSDLDIIMEVYDGENFKRRIYQLYHSQTGFRLKDSFIRGKKVVKANFQFNGFEFELFGQAQAVPEQNAYVHMVIEFELLKKYPTIREKIIRLKQQGVKTEPAFCQVLGISCDDPYEDLLVYGRELLGD